MSKIHLEKIKNRPLSYSSLSSWKWDKEHGTHQWAKRYLEGKDESSPELVFGKQFAESIENGTCPIKELMNELQDKKEHEFKCKLGKIELIGYADAFCDKTFRILQEVKTGGAEWDNKRVKKHEQLDMYCLMNFIINKIRPEDMDITLYWIPTKKVDRDNGNFSGHDYDIKFIEPIKVRAFKTKRTLIDITQFGAYIIKTHAEMLAFAENY